MGVNERRVFQLRGHERKQRDDVGSSRTALVTYVNQNDGYYKPSPVSVLSGKLRSLRAIVAYSSTRRVFGPLGSLGSHLHGAGRADGRERCASD